MSLVLHEKADSNVIELNLSGKLSKEDYEKFVPQFEHHLHDNQRPRLLVTMHGFDGWTVGGFWEDLKFDAKHFRDIEKIAFVGDEKWEAGMSKFCKAFTTAEIRFFYPPQMEEARSWVNS